MQKLYQQVTNMIIEQLQAGTLPWWRDWPLTPGNNVPCNARAPAEFPEQRQGLARGYRAQGKAGCADKGRGRMAAVCVLCAIPAGRASQAAVASRPGASCYQDRVRAA